MTSNETTGKGQQVVGEAWEYLSNTAENVNEGVSTVSGNVRDTHHRNNNRV